MVQVEKHDSREDVWFVHDGKVYDGTKFLNTHPGGAESILMVGGQDATEEFNAIHSSKAKSMLADFMIGLIGNKAESKDDIAPERAPIDKQVRACAVPRAAFRGLL
jgi:nitrate reductase (NAD(P)H)